MTLPGSNVAVIGAGPAGLTCALLLAQAGHRVTVLDRSPTLGGLWATARDDDGHFRSENSCKVYQASYHSAPALFERIGTRWEDHFVARHDLTRDWLRPFVRDSSVRDLAKLTRAYATFKLGDEKLRNLSVAEWLETRKIGEQCRDWMRATALGGVTGTLRMTMWEFFHRLRGNVGSILFGGGGTLYWNRQPPDSSDGFLPVWRAALDAAGAEFWLGEEVKSVAAAPGGGATVTTSGGSEALYDAVFLALPPRALQTLLSNSHPALSQAFGHSPSELSALLEESLYEHLGITWHFTEPLPTDLPLGGHNVRRGWHPILVQHAQYHPALRPPTVSVVVGSVSLDTDFRHPRLGTLAREYAPEELAQILWEDERLVDPTLPPASEIVVHGMSDATQVVRHGPLPVQARGVSVYLATSLNGAAPYFTASLESAIQAGAAAASSFEPTVLRLPTGPVYPHPWGGRAS